MAYTPKRGSYHGQSFSSESAYRNRLATDKGFRSYWEERQFHSGKRRDQGSGFYNAERKEGAYNFYLKQWISELDRKPKSYERAQFDIFYNAGRKEDWARTPNGALALLLDYIGMRPLEKYRGIAPGDTPRV